MNEKAPALKPAVSQPVIVKTTSMIDGQNEHAGIITKVIADDCVNVMVMPSGAQPYPIAAVFHERHSKAHALAWRFAPRVRS